jgi:hypothetical protein
MPSSEDGRTELDRWLDGLGGACTGLSAGAFLAAYFFLFIDLVFLDRKTVGAGRDR